MSENTAPHEHPSGPVRWRRIALPAEHGSWGLAIEPIALGLFVAPSRPGVAIGLAAFAAFLMHRPLRTAWSDIRRGRRYPRTTVAVRFAVLYGFVLVVSLAAAVVAAGWEPLAPVVLALPLFVVFGWLQSQNKARSWQAEMAAPVGFAAVSASIALAGSWAWPASVALWAAMVCRSVPSVLYIRARLRLEKGEPARIALSIGAHLVAVFVASLFVAADLLPPLALAAYVLLLARAGLGLSPYRLESRTQTIGIVETVAGAAAVLLIALGYWLA